MFNVKAFPTMSLTESGQVNPIRWAIVMRDGLDLTPTTAWFKCKDYFNDVVAAKKGIFFEQYGFNNTDVVEPGSKGVWVYVKGIEHMPTFETNTLATMNPEHPVLFEKDTPTKALLFIPEYYFSNTYRISLLTYLIRLGNQQKTGADMFESATQALDTIAAEVSPGLSSAGRAFAIRHGWDAREGDKYWWRYSSYTSDTPFTMDIKSYIHNCGVNAWLVNNMETSDAM